MIKKSSSYFAKKANLAEVTASSLLDKPSLFTVPIQPSVWCKQAQCCSEAPQCPSCRRRPVIQSFYSPNKVFMFTVFLSPRLLPGCQLVFSRPLLTPLQKVRNNVGLSVPHGGKEIKMSQGAFKAVFTPAARLSFLPAYVSSDSVIA